MTGRVAKEAIKKVGGGGGGGGEGRTIANLYRALVKTDNFVAQE